MVESVVTGDLKSPAFGRAGSSPARGTIFKRITRTAESFRIAGDFHDRKWYRKGSVLEYGERVINFQHNRKS